MEQIKSSLNISSDKNINISAKSINVKIGDVMKERFNKEEYLIKLEDVKKALVIYKDDEFSTKELLIRKKELEIILDYFDKEDANYKCKFCGKPFKLEKEKKYLVEVKNNLIFNSGEGQAFDCPYCGCQNIVNCNYCKKVSDNHVI